MYAMYIHHSQDDSGATLFGVICAAGVLGLLGIWTLIYRSIEASREADRLRMVEDKYSGETASRISQKMFWQGQTADQLRDSLGPPHAVDVKLLKTRRREIWKYHNYEAHRYRTRITLDDGIVTTWTTK